MNNNIGRFKGADAIQRFQQAQQVNAQPQQVDNQEAATQSSTTRKPVSKKDLADLMKGKAKDLGELVDNKDKVGEAQEAHIADGIGGLTSNSYTQKALKDMGFTDAELAKWFTKDSNGNYKMRDDIEYKYGNPRHQETGTIKTLDELKERMGINIRNQKIAETGYPAELFEAGFRPIMDLMSGKVVDFVLKEGVQLDDQMYGNNRVFTVTNEDTSKNIIIQREDGSVYTVELGESWAHGMANATAARIEPGEAMAKKDVDQVESGTIMDPLAQYRGVTEINDVQMLYDIGFNEEEIAEYFDKVESEDGGVKYVMKNIGFPAGQADGSPYVSGMEFSKDTYYQIPEDLAQLIKLTGVDERKNILSRFPEGMFKDCYVKKVYDGDANYECRFGYNKVDTAPDGKQIVTFYSPVYNDVKAIAIYNPEDGTYEWIIEPETNIYDGIANPRLDDDRIPNKADS